MHAIKTSSLWKQAYMLTAELTEKCGKVFVYAQVATQDQTAVSMFHAKMIVTIMENVAIPDNVLATRDEQGQRARLKLLVQKTAAAMEDVKIMVPANAMTHTQVKIAHRSFRVLMVFFRLIE